MVSQAYSALTCEICVELGYCGAVVDDKPSYVDDLVPKSGRITSAEFANLVIQADEEDPSNPAVAPHKERIRAAFVRIMGGDELDVSAIWTD